MVSNPAFAEKTPHPSNHGACVSENAKTKTLGEPNNIVAHAVCAHIRP